jgi:hypothetical protein
MSIRDVLNYMGEKVGEISEPTGVTWTEEQWSSKLAPYAKAPPSTQDIADSYLMHSIEDRKRYADNLLERFKFKNISEGINAVQGLHMHHRMRACAINFYGVPLTIDVLNLAVSGDIEIACLTIMNTTADDMSQPYHWLSQERLNWLVADMKSFLGWS